MGAHATCWIGNVEVITSRNYVSPAVMNLFRASDRNVRFPGDPQLPHILADQWEDLDPEFKFIYYSSPVPTVRDRLELEGYTLANCRRLFEQWRILEIEQREEWADHDSEGRSPEAKRIMEQLNAGRAAALQRLRGLTVEHWIECVRKIVADNLTAKDSGAHEDSYLCEMLRSTSDGWYGYEGPDPLVAIRLAIEVFPSAENFIYDLTDLLISECISEDEDPVEKLIDWSAGDYHVHGRVIVLTEGRSDVALLQPALEILSPHLADYFAFMDFAEYGGGAGQLANMVRAFAGAGVVNRVVALFDNDAAGIAAMRGLSKLRLPRNIVVTRLPNVGFLEAYPTLGPSGPSLMNINGMAASIELYLGIDVLRGAAEAPSPIQWTGYERSLGTYQGELLNKQEVQSRFIRKLERARTDAAFREAADWSGLRAILSVVFEAFHSLDEEMLSEQLRDFYRKKL